MTTPTSPAVHDTRDSFDTGPLSWVIGEIRDALGRSKASLLEALALDQDEQSTALRQAKSYLHQAHGALQIVDLDGVVIITETVEDLCDRIDSGQVVLNKEIVHAIENAYRALTEYLEELLSGGAHQPVRLFPYYRALLEVRGAERIHPADLFFPNLAIRPQFSGEQFHGRIDYVALRKQYERVLLPFLKEANPATELTNASVMRDIVDEVACAQNGQPSRGFWWVLHGFAEGVAAGLIRNELYIKQLFARINLQIRRLSEGSSSIAERLLRDALFFIARAERPSPKMLEIRQAYQLDGLVPPDYEKKRYGQIDVDALVAAKERLSAAKNIWNRIAGGDVRAASSFELEMSGLAEACSKLNAPSLSKLLRELNGIARHAAYSNPGEGVGLEMATSLLFVENALSQIAHLSDDFSARADALTARLLSIVSGEQPTEVSPWLDDMSRQAQQRQTMTVLVAEMQSSLRQVEKMLDEYFRDPTQRASLNQIDAILHQIDGALSVLDQDDAARAVRHTQDDVRRFAECEGVPDQSAFQHVAQNVGALSFFIETLQLQSDGVKKRFSFDDEQGIFRANMIEKKAATDLSLDLDLDLGNADATTHGIPSSDGTLAPPSSPLQTVEDELVLHQQQSAELAASFSAEPDNAELQGQLKEVLEQVRLGAALIDKPEVTERVQAAIDILDSPNFIASQDALADIISATAPVQQTPVAPLAPVEAPSTEEAIDAELLDIFLMEAEEVLACIRETVPYSRNDPYSQEHLTTLRRSFHTLKGSGRMVGLTAVGEVAWSIEQVLNMRLAETRPGDAELYALIEKAADVLELWVMQLKATGISSGIAAPLVQAAERVKQGRAFVFDDAPQINATLQHADEDIENAQKTLEQNKNATTPSKIVQGEVIAFPSLQTPELKRDDSVKQIGDIQISVPLHNIYLAETDELVRLLSQDIAEWRHEPDRQVNVQIVHAAHSLAGSSATVGFSVLQEIAHALEAILQYLSRQPVKLTSGDYDTLEHSIERIRFMLQMFALGEMPDREPHQVEILTQLLHEIDSRSVETPEFYVSAQDGYEVDDELLHNDVGMLPEQDIEEPDPEVSPTSTLSYAEPSSLQVEEDVTDTSLTLKDDLDADLLPVFLEEGRDMLPQVGQDLRLWQQHLDDKRLPQSLLRQLHTIKGSARMAGAMELGQHMHEMESLIEQIMHSGEPSVQVIDDLLARHDYGLYLFDLLQNPDASVPATHSDADTLAESAASVPSSIAPTRQGLVELPTLMPVHTTTFTTPATARFPTPNTAASTAGSSSLLRVRADIFDRLVNQAGEVSIARSKIETDVGAMRQSLSELNENVSRLRNQLRELEIQAETQITSRMSHSADREFDPLEFDRFTRLQELTRMLAESVNDVGSVQQSLNRTIENTSNDLIAQGRITRELQQDLMRVRMVQFASIAERLYRVTRQASKEMNKRVNLDIHGGSVEMDRGVLEKMVGPFEHLLRNAIVHGIESKTKRSDAGKAEVGELLVAVRQEGNEVVIQFSDDGQGLDLDGIRAKAKSMALITDESRLSDADVVDLIFHPGFSTAEQVTELAGRGVGMDVVRAEAAELGGRVTVKSEVGKGAQFTIHLPLTLAVTQVVLISAGEKVYALPSVLVEQVQQLRIEPLTAAYKDGAVMWQGQRIPIFYLSTLLGDHAASPVSQHYSPVMILKSGSDRVAIHVDEVRGNQEVVVKNIGPQLARLVGIAGATVLGSGEIVLILNPIPLAERAALQHGSAGAMTLESLTTPKSEKAQGLRTQAIVMVVDDSLTVRRVTQRMLVREGYQVVLAKDGVDALERLQDVMPDVMLVDIEMPRMDGFDLTRNVRNGARTKHIPIIMITSRTAAKHRNYAMELGVNEYFGKPYQEDALLKTIAGFVAKEVPAV
mgnify:CR=1 FL=1